MFEIKEIRKHIYHLEYVNKFDLFLSLMRCQEFYEANNKNIKNKKFSFEDLIVVYSEMNKGEFTYFSDYSAFNFPGRYLKNFIELFRDDFLVREKKTIDSILTYNDSNQINMEDAYYIATYKKNNYNQERDIRHETAHAFFNIIKNYKKKMTSLIKKNKRLYDKCRIHLKELKYDDSVLADEMQSYLSTSGINELKLLGFENISEKEIKPFKEIFCNESNSRNK
jgi:hypothetical protein